MEQKKQKKGFIRLQLQDDGKWLPLRALSESEEVLIEFIFNSTILTTLLRMDSFDLVRLKLYFGDIILQRQFADRLVVRYTDLDCFV